MLMFEYKVIDANDFHVSEAELNKLGAEGWMLVSVHPQHRASPVFYFRRPKDKIYQNVKSAGDTERSAQEA